MVFPATILPFLFFIITVEQEPSLILAITALFLPIAFGAWNVLYVGFAHQRLATHVHREGVEDFTSGLLLGVVLLLPSTALNGNLLRGIAEGRALFAVLLPALCGLIYYLVISRLNRHLGLT